MFHPRCRYMLSVLVGLIWFCPLSLARLDENPEAKIERKITCRVVTHLDLSTEEKASAQISPDQPVGICQVYLSDRSEERPFPCTIDQPHTKQEACGKALRMGDGT